MEASKGCREKERGMAALAVQITCGMFIFLPLSTKKKMRSTDQVW